MSCCSAVIVGCKAFFCHCNRQGLFFTRCKNTGFRKAGQDTRWLSKNTLRSLHVNLNNLFTCRFSGVFYNCRHGYLIHVLLFGLCSYGKRRIGKAESKRIQYFLFCKGLKIAVSDVDVLFVLIADQITKAACGRIVFNIFRDGIRQLTTRADSSHQHISDTVSAFLSALPYIENSCRIALFHPFHVDDISNIQHNDRSFKCFADLFYHLFFRIR